MFLKSPSPANALLKKFIPKIGPVAAILYQNEKLYFFIYAQIHI